MFYKVDLQTRHRKHPDIVRRCVDVLINHFHNSEVLSIHYFTYEFLSQNSLIRNIVGDYFNLSDYQERDVILAYPHYRHEYFLDEKENDPKLLEMFNIPIRPVQGYLIS